MRIELIRSWKKIDQRGDWVIERAVRLELDEPVPPRPMVRARNKTYKVYAPQSKKTEQEAILYLYDAIDLLQSKYKDRVGKPRSHKCFDTYEQAFEYAKLRHRFGYKRITAYVGVDMWIFEQVAGQHGGPLIGHIYMRNAL